MTQANGESDEQTISVHTQSGWRTGENATDHIRLSVTMKLFQIVRKDFEFLGIDVNRSQFSGKSSTVYLVHCTGITSNIVFFIVNANSFLEYTQCIFVIITLIFLIATFTALLSQKGKLFELMAGIEKYVDESECANP